MGILKDLAKRIASGEVLRDGAFHIAKKQNIMDGKKVLLLWFMNFFDKTSSPGSGVNNGIKKNQQQLAEELHKLIIRLKKEKCIYYYVVRQYL